jgi:hypothetical protein
MSTHSRGMVCVLTQQEADDWKSTGVHPPCIAHRHVSLSTAIRWREYPRHNCIVKAEWAGKNALMVEFEEAPMMWATVYVGRGESDGPGMSVRQLVRGPAPIPSSGRRNEGAIPVGGRRGLSTTMVRDANLVPSKKLGENG